jgi:short-subunit dehydrogenase
VGFSTSFRPEAAHHNIKVNVVCPGFINTEILATQPFLKVKREDMLKKAPKKGMCPLRCAETILLGVRRNREIITVPFTSRLLWWLYRYVPIFIPLFNRNLVKYFHSIRMDSVIPDSKD